MTESLIYAIQVAVSIVMWTLAGLMVRQLLAQSRWNH